MGDQQTYARWKCGSCGREWGDTSGICSGCLTNSWAKKVEQPSAQPDIDALLVKLRAAGKVLPRYRTDPEVICAMESQQARIKDLEELVDYWQMRAEERKATIAEPDAIVKRLRDDIVVAVSNLPDFTSLEGANRSHQYLRKRLNAALEATK